MRRPRQFHLAREFLSEAFFAEIFSMETQRLRVKKLVSGVRTQKWRGFLASTCCFAKKMPVMPSRTVSVPPAQNVGHTGTPEAAASRGTMPILLAREKESPAVRQQICHSHAVLSIQKADTLGHGA
ncbi:hypothetical protein [uncultured Desulfovibrio sp.]|uniref:hypothetical protein n=1 Tax=uncultured Desulfovibrio sp. TaxID=167968 RepID=UPI00260694A6|nr:hypothetical protein [uncultured Desulfovibrio sp.]